MGTPSKGNPQEPEALHGEVQGGSDDLGRLPSRLCRYAKAKDRALVNLSAIDARIEAHEQIPVMGSEQFVRGLRRNRPLIEQCGSYLHFRSYYTVGTVRLATANFCKVHLLCPLCAIRRGAKTLKAYLDRYEVIKAQKPTLRLSLVTLTVRNGPDLGERFEHLKTAVSKSLKYRTNSLRGCRHKTEWSKMVGLVGSYETTKNGALNGSKSGWHPHCHMLVLHYDRFDYVALKDEWLRITGDSHVLNVQEAKHPKDPAKDFCEVFKYALKFSDLTPSDNVEAFEVFQRRRLLFSAGEFRGVEVPESMLDELLDDLPFFDLFYKHFTGSGYSLIKHVIT